MTYKSLDSQLTGRSRNSRKLANNTVAIRREHSIAVRLHQTDVVTFYADGRITLNSGGYRTRTTKDRINAYAPVNIGQRRGVWSFTFGGSEHVFADGITLYPDGSVTGAAQPSQMEADRKLRAEVMRFAKLCALSLPLDLPGAGDCFYCQMQTEDGKSLGDSLKDCGHLTEHMREGYVVPSLVYRALVEAGNPALVVQSAFKNDQTNGADFLSGLAKGRVQSSVNKYLKRRLALA